MLSFTFREFLKFIYLLFFHIMYTQSVWAGEMAQPGKFMLRSLMT